MSDWPPTQLPTTMNDAIDEKCAAESKIAELELAIRELQQRRRAWLKRYRKCMDVMMKIHLDAAWGEKP